MVQFQEISENVFEQIEDCDAEMNPYGHAELMMERIFRQANPLGSVLKKITEERQLRKMLREVYDD